MNLTESLKNQIEDLYNDTPENIHGVGLGYKYVNNQKTDTIGIIFKVYKKKSLSELTQNEILPSSIEIDNTSYVTDVIEETLIPSALGCYSFSSPVVDPEILRLRGTPSFLYPIKGGQEIIKFPHGWVLNSNNTVSRQVGTLGLLAIDNHDNNIVGITNAHVACSNLFIASDRIESIEKNNPYNIIEETQWPVSTDPLDKYSPGTVSANGNALFPSAPRLKRYQPFRKSSTNTVDCAVMFLNNDLVTANSFGIHAPSTEPVSSLKPPFATTAELDSLFTSNPFLFSTGRTTGPKGWGQTSSCRLVVTAVGFSQNIAFGGDVVPFSNIILYRYQDGSPSPAASGDSGSAVLANIGGTVKVIGLLFAANTNTAYLCRIDEIAQKLNIRAWQDDHVYNASAPCGNPYIDVLQSPPVNPTLSRIVVCDFDDSRSSFDSIEISGVKYYQAGCTTKNTYTNISTSSTLMSFSRSNATAVSSDYNWGMLRGVISDNIPNWGQP